MSDKEHRDVYIAAAVGGTVLVLLLLYLYGGQNVPIASAAGTALPTADVGSGVSPYNYNVAPYGGSGPIQYASRNLPPVGGGGCCDDCGPDQGGLYINPGVAVYQTLISG